MEFHFRLLRKDVYIKVIHNMRNSHAAMFLDRDLKSIVLESTRRGEMSLWVGNKWDPEVPEGGCHTVGGRGDGDNCPTRSLRSPNSLSLFERTDLRTRRRCEK